MRRLGYSIAISPWRHVQRAAVVDVYVWATSRRREAWPSFQGCFVDVRANILRWCARLADQRAAQATTKAEAAVAAVETARQRAEEAARVAVADSAAALNLAALLRELAGTANA